MKIGLFLVFGLVFMCGTTTAAPLGGGITFGYGQANSKGRLNPHIDIYRVGLKKDFSSKWLKTSSAYLSGYFEISYSRWEFNDQGIEEIVNAVGFSPVFAYYFGDESDFVKFYIEAGIGVAYLDEYYIAGRHLSSSFQFEDRVGVGAVIGFIDLNFRYMHYSNADLKLPNDGIDIWIFTTAFQF